MEGKLKVLVYEFVSAGGLGQRPAGGAERAAYERLLAQGISMRDALVHELAAQPEVLVQAATGADADTAAAPACPSLPCARCESPAAFLARVAAEFDRVWVIAPETGGMLEALHGVVGAQRWVGSDVSAIRVSASKSATRAVLSHHGIAVPWGWDAASPSAPPPDIAERWVVKPDDGAGSEYTQVIGDFSAARASARQRRLHGQPVTLEAWIEGRPMSLSVLYHRSRAAELLSINDQHIDMGSDGSLTYRGVRVGSEALDSALGGQLAGLAQRIGAALPGLSGFVGVDFVLTAKGQPVVIEINPRLTCAYVELRARLGLSLASEILGLADVAPRQHAR